MASLHAMNALQIAALLAAGLNVEVLSTEEARKRWPDPSEPYPSPRYDDIDMSQRRRLCAPRLPRAPDPERLAAAEAKRARKAAKRKEQLK